MTVTNPMMAYPAFSADRTKAGSDRLPFVVVLFVITVLIPISGYVGIVLTGARIILLVMFIPMLIRLLSGRCGPIIATDWLFALHLVWVVVSIGYHHSLDKVVAYGGSTGIEFLGGYLLGRTMIRNRQQMQQLAIVFATALCCTLPFAAFEAVTGRPLLLEMINKLPMVWGAPKTYSELRMGLTRVQFAYVTPIHYGLVASLAISLSYVGLKDVISDTRRLVLTAGVCGCVFLSLSSGALLPMMLSFYLFVWAWMFRNFRHPWRILLYLAIAGYVTIDMLSNRSPYKVFISYATFSSGTAYWRDAIAIYGMENVWANPWLGIGLNDWVRPSWMVTSSVDNFWLVMAMRYGIPGFLTVAGGYAWALWRIGRAKVGTDPELERLRLAWMLTFGISAFTLYTVHIWFEIYAFTFFLLGSGVWLATAQPRTDDTALQDEAEADPRGSRNSLSRYAWHKRGAFTSSAPPYTRPIGAIGAVSRGIGKAPQRPLQDRSDSEQVDTARAEVSSQAPFSARGPARFSRFPKTSR